MGHSKSKPKKNIEPEELIRLMNDNIDVMIQYYNTNHEFVEKYIVEHFWEEDVDRWLTAIRKRSPAEALKVRKIDYLKQKNGMKHHTVGYENTSLVVRRAASFDIDVHFGNRDFDSHRDDLTLSFGVGKTPTNAAGTKILCPVNNNPAKDNKQWHCYIVSSVAKKVTIRVNVPSTAIVGRYAVSLEIVSGISKGRMTESHKDNSVVVLFNPFSQDDTVYMSDAKQRNEYVMNDEGFIARGSYNRISKKSWQYSQFDDGVLDSVLNMINNDTRFINQPVKSRKKCNDPVFVSRVLSAMVNCNDDKGVLWGRWDGEYGDGKSPGSWFDSAKIFKQWSDNGMKPVKYGQCWVFAGLLTTALRAIGIPARCITNFASAHDTNANVTVDMYYDEDTGYKMDETSDSVWNFHVWNEGWFKRHDLPEGYDGWQVVDATPQELSEVDDVVLRRRELFQCGPAPVKAIKEGHINLGYDGNFIFGEVNADLVNWMVKDGKVTSSAGIRKRDVGRNISTKAVGSFEIDDVTHEYKYKEGTDNERKAFAKAYARGIMDHSTNGIKNPELLVDPKFEVTVEPSEEPVYIGSKVSATVKVTNLTDKEIKKVLIKVSSSTKRHVGATHAHLKKTVKVVDLAAGRTTRLTFEVEASEYLRNIVDNRIVNIRAVATDPKDGNSAVGEVDVELEVPECMSVTAKWGSQSIPRRVTSKFNVVLENKLPFTLTNGKFEIVFRGSGTDDRSVVVGHPIAPGEEYTVEGVEVSPLENWRTIYANAYFESAELRDMTISFRIKAADE